MKTNALPVKATRQLFREQVDVFLQLHGARLVTADNHTAVTDWALKQSSSEINQQNHLAAQQAFRDTASDTGAYATLWQLMQMPQFATLDRQRRRALHVAKRTYEKEMPRLDDGPEFQSLRRKLDKDSMALDALRTAGGDVIEQPADIAAGQDRPFTEMLRNLARERNRLAAMRGFASFYHMRVVEEEMDFGEMVQMLSEIKMALDELQPRIQNICDNGPSEPDLDILAGRAGTAREVLLKTAQLMGVRQATIEAILEKSDLYPRPGKDGHWYSFPINAPFDVRAFCNIPEPPAPLTMPDLKGQLLHEIFGHGVDYSCLNPNLDPLLKTHEPLTAEAIARLAESLVYQPGWLTHVLGMKTAELNAIQPQLQRLQLERSALTLRHNIATVEFEIALYRDPNQDLDALYSKVRAWSWSDDKLVLDLGSWAVDVPHYVGYPCYCHHYVLGLVWDTQIRDALKRRFGSYTSRRVGPFMARQRSTGLLYTPDEQIVRLTGQPISADALITELKELTGQLEANIASSSAGKAA